MADLSRRHARETVASTKIEEKCETKRTGERSQEQEVTWHDRRHSETHPYVVRHESNRCTRVKVAAFPPSTLLFVHFSFTFTPVASARAPMHAHSSQKFPEPPSNVREDTRRPEERSSRRKINESQSWNSKYPLWRSC